MRIIITLLTAMSLLLNSSCSSTHLQTDEHSGSESENIIIPKKAVTQESESTTADAETAATTPETANPIDEYDDDELQDIIDRSLGTLTETAYSWFNAEDSVAGHPEAFEAIVSLGKRAIPFLEKYTDTNHEMTSKEANLCAMAKTAAYAIDPSLYDLSYESPDGNTRIKLSVSSFMSILYTCEVTTVYGKLTMETKVSPYMHSEFSGFDYTNAEILWSDDENYAVIIGQRKSDCFPYTALLIDTLTGNLIEFPSLEIYNRIREKEPELKSFLSFSAENCDWNSENPTIEFELRVGAAFYPQVIHGKYTFDTKTNKLTNITYDPVTVSGSGDTLTDEEIRNIVYKNLDILAGDGREWIYPKDLITLYPKEFENILSLDTRAIPYLNEIMEKYASVSSGTREYDLCGIAYIVRYVIEPDDRDKVSVSPDGKYIFTAFDDNTTAATDILDYVLIEITDASTGKIMFVKESTYRNIDVIWDDQQKYIIISNGYMGYHMDTEIIDLEKMSEVVLPAAATIRAIAAEKAGKENIEDFTKYVIRFESVSGSTVKFRFSFLVTYSADRISGEYTFNIENDEITDFHAATDDASIIMYP